MKKKLYLIYLTIYILIFLIELVIYLKFNSTLYGFIYMLINLAVLFLLSFSIYNYSEFNIKIRLSKNGILIFLICRCPSQIPIHNPKNTSPKNHLRVRRGTYRRPCCCSSKPPTKPGRQSCRRPSRAGLRA